MLFAVRLILMKNKISIFLFSRFINNAAESITVPKKKITKKHKICTTNLHTTNLQNYPLPNLNSLEHINLQCSFHNNFNYQTYQLTMFHYITLFLHNLLLHRRLLFFLVFLVVSLLSYYGINRPCN